MVAHLQAKMVSQINKIWGDSEVREQTIKVGRPSCDVEMAGCDLQHADVLSITSAGRSPTYCLTIMFATHI